MKEKKMRALVTGGAGFMGSHVADHLLAMGHEVTVLDDLSGGFSQNVPSAANFVQGSITDHGLIDDLFELCQPADQHGNTAVQVIEDLIGEPVNVVDIGRFIQ